jgi:hypothetical protein
MKLFSEYLAEVEKENMKSNDGTFAALKLSKDSGEKLHEWLEKNDIKELIDEDEYHCTIVFSNISVPDVKNIPIKFPIKASVKEWKILGTENLLCAVLSNRKIVDIFNKTIKMGAKTDYPSFIPHISLAKNFKGELPSEYPNFDLKFEKFKVEPLNADFKY